MRRHVLTWCPAVADRFGKTKHGIVRALCHRTKGLLVGRRVGWFAPQYKYLDEAWRDFLRFLPPETIKHKNDTKYRLEMTTGGVLECWTTDGGDPGRSREYDLAMFDEAAKEKKLKEVWTKSILATLMVPRGEAWFYSTPRGMDDFQEFWARGQPGPKAKKGWKSWIMPSSSNPYVTADELATFREEMSNLVYRQEVLAEFVSDCGDYFLRKYFDGKLYDAENLPDVRKILSIDFGITKGDDKDPTVIMPLGGDHERNLFVLPGTKRIWEDSGRRLAVEIVDSIGAHKPDVVLVERGHIWSGIRSSVEEEMRARKKWRTFIEVTPTKAKNDDPSRDAKQARARSAQAMAQWGRVWLPDDAFTHDHLLPELLSFPTGKHDDQVDTLAMAANYFQDMGMGKAPAVPEKVLPERSVRRMREIGKEEKESGVRHALIR